MPVENINRYTCPVTGQIEYGTDVPPGWFTIEGQVFSPDAQTPLAQYVVDHPGVGFRQLVEGLTAQPHLAVRAVAGAILNGDDLPDQEQTPPA
jgi:hypothetical protein